jgi:hypothetical protein
LLHYEWPTGKNICLGRKTWVWAWRGWSYWRHVGVGGFDEVNRRLKISDGLVANEMALAVGSEVGLLELTPVSQLSPR